MGLLLLVMMSYLKCNHGNTRGYAGPGCHYELWKCKEGQQCIDETEVCDKEYHCSDFSDEDHVMCAKWNCRTGFWKCKDGLQCIKDSDLCDGSYNCHDKSDEDLAVCPQWNCTTGYWKCKHAGKCRKDLDQVCNGKYICRDKSDEDPIMCALYNCLSGYWKCKHGLQCINETYVCDGRSFSSCKDKSDEDVAFCTNWNCPDGRWKCNNGLQSGQLFTQAIWLIAQSCDCDRLTACIVFTYSSDKDRLVKRIQLLQKLVAYSSATCRTFKRQIPSNTRGHHYFPSKRSNSHR